jgi:hypothetical protein
MGDEMLWKRDELRKLREEAELTIANLQRTRDSIDRELKVAREVLERVERELRDTNV